MKAYTYCLTLFLFISSLPLSVLGQATPETIQKIRLNFQTINSDSSYTILSLSNKSFMSHITDGGGELTGYFKGDSIKKIHVQVGLSYCIQTSEYYFLNEQLSFIYHQERIFPYIDSTATFDYTRTELIFEGRYYFENNKLVKQNEKGKRRIDTNTNSFGWLQQASEYYNILKSQ